MTDDTAKSPTKSPQKPPAAPVVVEKEEKEEKEVNNCTELHAHKVCKNNSNN